MASCPVLSPRRDHGSRRGPTRAGRPVDRRPAARRSARQPAAARRGGQPAVRPHAARRGVPDPSPRRAPQARMTEPQAAKVQAQFGAAAEAYVACPGFATGDDLAQLVAWGRARRPRRVLDVATGGGHTALAFTRVAGHVTACDLTEPMLAAARGLVRDRGAAAAFVAGDAVTLPFRDGAFDVVTCRIAPHHFPDVAGAVREVRRVLRPGGSFLVQDILGHDDAEAAAFITEVERRRDPTHIRAYRAVEWKAFLRAAGLTVMESAI